MAAPLPDRNRNKNVGQLTRARARATARLQAEVLSEGDLEISCVLACPRLMPHLGIPRTKQISANSEGVQA